MARTGWRLRIRHTTGYRYDREVTASYNEVRLSPPSTSRQVSLDSRVEVSPPSRIARYYDYWGTVVHAFDILTPHAELVVIGTSVVETSAPPAPERGVDWLAVDDANDRWCEFLLPSPFVPVDDELFGRGAELRRSGYGPQEAVRRAVEQVQAQLVYERGSTTVSTTAPEAWARGQGVCQDFAHVTLAVLRGMGVPARYVSGYVHPMLDAEIGETVKGESHAWVEAWLGAWEPIDATSDDPAVGERHVMVARGRDYGDVTPLKGVFTGAESPAPVVTVELARTA